MAIERTIPSPLWLVHVINVQHIFKAFARRAACGPLLTNKVTLLTNKVNPNGHFPDLDFARTLIFARSNSVEGQHFKRGGLFLALCRDGPVRLDSIRLFSRRSEMRAENNELKHEQQKTTELKFKTTQKTTD